VHAQALTKFLWYHAHALRHEPSQYGVRLSFALGYWLELAAVFPPARDAFIRIRDEAEQAFRDDPAKFALFHDVASLNRHLGEGVRTADLFAEVVRRDYAAAQRLYHVAEVDLVAAGRYHACRPFLNGRRRMELASQRYQVSKKHEESQPPQKHPFPKLARELYIHDVATLVALLVINGRADDASRAYEDALLVLNDDDFRIILDAAMTGHLPDRRHS
jgi:hypothetical protein